MCSISNLANNINRNRNGLRYIYLHFAKVFLIKCFACIQIRIINSTTTGSAHYLPEFASNFHGNAHTVFLLDGLLFPDDLSISSSAKLSLLGPAPPPPTLNVGVADLELHALCLMDLTL
jgi:hypothetical protein